MSAPSAQPATFSDIRASCQAAQTRIMRLQQATNTQVGLTSSIRELWFNELRQIAQCFIAAQQTGAKLEKAMNTEKNQLKGALSNALNELDLLRVQRDAADQEARFLRGRLDELMAQLKAQESMPAQRPHSPAKSLHNESSVDFLRELPTAVENMPFSPPKHKGGAVSRADDLAPAKAKINLNKGYHNSKSSKSRFFSRVEEAQSIRSQSSESGDTTPDVYHGRARSGFARTPGAVQGPFPTPPPSRRPTDNMQLALTARPFQPPPPSQNLARRPNHKTHRPVPSRAGTPAQQSFEVVLRGNQGPLSDFSPGVGPQSSSADEERVTSIFGVFNAIKVWVAKYCPSASKESVASLAMQHPHLWDYALDITYPNNRQNAASHASFLLTNRATRGYFITRLIIQYVVQRLWSPEAWEGVDDRLNDVLVGIKRRLDPKFGYDAVLQPHERHALVEKRSNAIYDFINQPSWISGESGRVTNTTNHLKSLLRPMVSSSQVDFDAAAAELGTISVAALRLSAILNTSRLSFQFQFNDCGIKYSDQSHRALNSALSSRDLQSQQWRVMCVVTPGITYRNDAGVSVDPRFLAKANVLVMQ